MLPATAGDKSDRRGRDGRTDGQREIRREGLFSFFDSTLIKSMVRGALIFLRNKKKKTTNSGGPYKNKSFGREVTKGDDLPFPPSAERRRRTKRERERDKRGGV